MKLTALLIEKVPTAAATALTVGSPAVAAATWVTYVDVLTRILIALACIATQVLMGWYWWAKRKREEKYTDTESGL